MKNKIKAKVIKSPLEVSELRNLISVSRLTLVQVLGDLSRLNYKTILTLNAYLNKSFHSQSQVFGILQISSAVFQFPRNRMRFRGFSLIILVILHSRFCLNFDRAKSSLGLGEATNRLSRIFVRNETVYHVESILLECMQ